MSLPSSVVHERIDRADLPRDGVYLVQQRHDGQLMRHRDVGAHETRVRSRRFDETREVLRAHVERACVRRLGSMSRNAAFHIAGLREYLDGDSPMEPESSERSPTSAGSGLSR